MRTRGEGVKKSAIFVDIINGSPCPPKSNPISNTVKKHQYVDWPPWKDSTCSQT